MNQIAVQQNNQKLPATSVGFASGNGTKINPQNLGEIIRFAETMSQADIALPQHLRNNPGACMAVAMQALEWQMSPFAVASKSYAVKGAIAYEAQLIAAVVNTRSGIKGRLKYEFNVTGDDLTCRVYGVIDGEECEYTSPRVGNITTKNSPLWKTDPQQQLGYFSARSWARRHVPEVLLGVYDRDEVESFQGSDKSRDTTQLRNIVIDPLSDEPITHSEIITADGEIISEYTQQQDTPAEDTPIDACTDGGGNPPSSATLETKGSVNQLTDQDKDSLRELIIRLKAAVGDDPAVIGITCNAFLAGDYPLSEYAKQKAATIAKHFKAVCKQEMEIGDAIAMSCGIAQIEETEVQ